MLTCSSEGLGHLRTDIYTFHAGQDLEVQTRDSNVTIEVLFVGRAMFVPIGTCHF